MFPYFTAYHVKWKMQLTTYQNLRRTLRWYFILAECNHTRQIAAVNQTQAFIAKIFLEKCQDYTLGMVFKIKTNIIYVTSKRKVLKLSIILTMRWAGVILLPTLLHAKYILCFTSAPHLGECYATRYFRGHIYDVHSNRSWCKTIMWYLLLMLIGLLVPCYEGIPATARPTPVCRPGATMVEQTSHWHQDIRNSTGSTSQLTTHLFKSVPLLSLSLVFSNCGTWSRSDKILALASTS